MFLMCIRYQVQGSPAEPPEPINYEVEPVQGEAGQIYKFEFLYRSRSSVSHSLTGVHTDQQQKFFRALDAFLKLHLHRQT